MPESDPHGECRAAIERLHFRIAEQGAKLCQIKGQALAWEKVFDFLVGAGWRPGFDDVGLNAWESAGRFIAKQAAEIERLKSHAEQLEIANRTAKEALVVYARFDYYLFLLDRLGQQTDPTRLAREALNSIDAAMPPPGKEGV